MCKLTQFSLDASVVINNFVVFHVITQTTFDKCSVLFTTNSPSAAPFGQQQKMKMEVRFLLLFLGLVHGEDQNHGCVSIVKGYEDPTSLDCSNISSFSAVQEWEPNLQIFIEIMKVNSSNITTVPKSAFSTFINVKSMVLTDLHIKQIEAGAFSGLKYLTELDLSHNELKKLEFNMFDSPSPLAVLKLCNNSIYEIKPRSLAALSNLKELDLSRNNFSRIRGDVFEQLGSLKVLNLSQNPLEIFCSQKLPVAELILAECSLKKIDTWLHVPMVEKIWLNDNKLRTLKPLRWKPKDLNTFVLDNNRIASIHEKFFWGLWSLTHLYLSNNKISDVDSNWFRDLVNLKVLRLGYNRIKTISNGAFDALTALEVLDLSNNQLKNLPQDDLRSLSNLRALYFDYNQISSFDFTGLSEHLKEIRMNENRWNCGEVPQMYEGLKNKSIILDSTVYNEHNIACTSRNRKTSLAEIIKSSAMANFFNDGFSNTKFFKIFDQNLI